MDRPQRIASFTPFITCSTCDVEVPMHMMAGHICSPVIAPSLVVEPEPVQLPTIETPLAQPAATRPPRPFLPRIDPLAFSRTMTVQGELTPESSGPGSAAVSPISPALGTIAPSVRSLRKRSPPASRRPPSPELLSQDCAFPHFPTSKTKRQDPKSVAQDRTQTAEIASIHSFHQSRKRSASIGVPKARVRQSTDDLSRPSTAVNSRPGSRQSSADTVPPMPPVQHTSSQSPSEMDGGGQSMFSNTSCAPSPNTDPTSQTPSTEGSPAPELVVETKNGSVVGSSSLSAPASNAGNNSPSPTAGTYPQAREPAYRSKRPPPISNMPPSFLAQHSLPKTRPEPSFPPPPPTPTSTIARTLTNLFSRKRGQSTSSKRSNPKTPATDGPRFIALSPDPDPQDAPNPSHSSHSSIYTDVDFTPALPGHNGIQEVPPPSTGVTMACTDYDVPQPSEAQIIIHEDAHEEDRGQNPHEPQRDTLQMEEDLEKRLAAMGVPHLSVVAEQEDHLKRASLDSASSYGSIGFTYSSTSSRSFHNFEGHSQGSSISTARTASSIEDAFLSPFAKVRNPDVVPDSPTDPYLVHGRLATVPEGSSSPAEDQEILDSYLEGGKFMPVFEVVSSPDTEKDEDVSQRQPQIPVPPEPEHERMEAVHTARQRRPSTPGAVRGQCRGCSKPILSGQKSVSSKDGRLTGKYHKGCFSCMTCKEPFATADFYVYEDHPYCAHHYHELNETLCEGCGKGIEGPYLETSNVSGRGAKKFHPDCLRCETCKLQLDDDYFELGGSVYCEKDAFRVSSGPPRSLYDTTPSRPSPLNREYVASGASALITPGAKFPERRLTRLMTTY